MKINVLVSQESSLLVRVLTGSSISNCCVCICAIRCACRVASGSIQWGLAKRRLWRACCQWHSPASSERRVSAREAGAGGCAVTDVGIWVYP